MSNNIFSKIGKIAIIFIVATVSNACTDYLDKEPTNDLTADKQFKTVEDYKQGLASVYSNLVYSNFLRQYWGMQEFTTDEAVSTWNDDDCVVLHQLAWSSDSPAISQVYSTMLMTITYCNNYINETEPGILSGRGFNDVDSKIIEQFHAEARFVRAFCFWVLMDIYGNPPFPTPEDLGYHSPKQIQRADLFDYLITELNDIAAVLAEPRSNEWGRADKAAAWALLSRICLNGEVYTGAPHYDEAINYCNKILSAGYSLEKDYSWLMLADNDKNTNEFIFTLNYKNSNTTTWQGTNFLALGAAGVPEEVNGMSGSWNCFRMTQQLVAKFPTADTSVDRRGQFWTQGQNLEVLSVSNQTDGYSSWKYRNVDREGNRIVQNNSYNNLSDIDFPIFRLAEIYLTYAEAALRGAKGADSATALRLINKQRGRAYACDPDSNAGNISMNELTLDFIIDEKAREMYWEAQRRTDLVRFNLLTSADYLWAWKGNALEGKAVDAKYNIFPLPTSDILANQNLKQNTNY